MILLKKINVKNDFIDSPQQIIIEEHCQAWFCWFFSL